MPKTVTLHITIPDEIECPDCLAAFEFDLNDIALVLGQCECGAEIALQADENGIELGVQQ